MEEEKKVQDGQVAAEPNTAPVAPEVTAVPNQEPAAAPVAPAPAAPTQV